jgi:hypothetical protein
MESNHATGCSVNQSDRGLTHGVNCQAVLDQGDAMSFGLYSIGFAILIGGLIYAAHLMHMPAHWIAVGAIVLLGVGIVSGVKATRQKDSAE